MLPGVAKPLNGHANVFRFPLAYALNFLDALVRSSSGRIVAPEASTQRHRLAGDYRRRALATDLRVLIHHPAHDPGVGVHIRRRHIGLGTDEVRDLVDIAAA